MLVGDAKELTDAFLKSGGVLFPDWIVQEHAHGIDADALGPIEFHVDPFWIERIRLPHFQLIDGSGRDVVAAHQPGLPGIPSIGSRL